MMKNTNLIFILFIAIFFNFTQVHANPVTQKSQSGSVFTQVLNTELGNAWMDPDGSLWSEAAKNKRGDMLEMDQRAAIKYCQSIHAQLPVAIQFEALARFLGAGSETGYLTEILPDLNYSEYWTASVNKQNSDLAYTFDSKEGVIYSKSRPYAPTHRTRMAYVRCVRMQEGKKPQEADPKLKIWACEGVCRITGKTGFKSRPTYTNDVSVYATWGDRTETSDKSMVQLGNRCGEYCRYQDSCQLIKASCEPR